MVSFFFTTTWGTSRWLSTKTDKKKHYLGKWSNLTNIFQTGWNHQVEKLGGDFNQCFIITLNMTHLVSPKGCIRWMGKDIWRNHHNWGRIWGNPSLQFLIARWRNLLRFLKTSKRTQEIFGKKRYPTALEDLNDHTDLIFAGRKILEGQFVGLGWFGDFWCFFSQSLGVLPEFLRHQQKIILVGQKSL